MNSKHLAKKHLGQNFLNDPRIQQKIITSCALEPHDHVIEIGPGQGALTHWIAPMVHHLVCVEADRDLIGALQEKFQQPSASVVHADFLEWPIPTDNRYKVIGNIPYNISSPIVERIIEHRQYIDRAFLTVQLEFGQRLAAKPGTKAYGALTCFVQYHADVQVLFNIKAGSFHPKPKVDSCFLSLTMRDKPLVETRDESLMFRMIHAAFNQRRKTLINAISGIVEKDKLTKALFALNISPLIRGEMLSLKNFADICNAYVL